MDDLPVRVVNPMELAELERRGSLDEVGLGGLGVLVAERGDDDVGEVDELGVDLENSSSRVQLGLDSGR